MLKMGTLYKISKWGSGDSKTLRYFLFMLGFIPMYIFYKLTHSWLMETSIGNEIGGGFIGDVLLGSIAEAVGLAISGVIIIISGYLIRRSIKNGVEKTFKAVKT